MNIIKSTRAMRTLKILFIGHLATLAFGLGGLLIALPHPELWAGSHMAIQVFNFGIRYAGSLHILFGAATMLLFGLLCVGPRKTLIFFAAAATISLSMELLGTGTGFPFGAYSYTDFLGIKIAGRVPYSIPLSWFYMGFASYLLANMLVARLNLRRRTLWPLVGGAYFLTVWDLVLDPAMASPNLPIHFWNWHISGPYFGMPVRNLVGWTLTGLIFMSVSRLLWRRQVDPNSLAVWVPYGVYVANTVFAIALSIGAAGLWLPPVLGVVFGIVPATYAMRLNAQRTRGTPGAASRPSAAGGVAARMTALALRVGGRALLRREADLTVRGLDHVPASGPVVIAARHFHHLDDGCALLASVARPVHIMVALDWLCQPRARRQMEWACRLAGWPVVLRAERLRAPEATPSAFAVDEVPRYLRHGTQDAVHLLRRGEVVVIFPEAYPNVDPSFTLKRDLDEFLPFRPGFVRIARLAGRDGQTRVPIVPAGLAYRRDARGRWQITLAFGPPVAADTSASPEEVAHMVEERVQALSLAPGAVAVDATQPSDAPGFAASLPATHAPDPAAAPPSVAQEAMHP
jgi:putative membrane protein